MWGSFLCLQLPFPLWNYSPSGVPSLPCLWVTLYPSKALRQRGRGKKRSEGGREIVVHCFRSLITSRQCCLMCCVTCWDPTYSSCFSFFGTLMLIFVFLWEVLYLYFFLRFLLFYCPVFFYVNIICKTPSHLISQFIFPFHYSVKCAFYNVTTLEKSPGSSSPKRMHATLLLWVFFSSWFISLDDIWVPFK